jgi:hypothetical protein
MTMKPTDAREALKRLADVFSEDILSAPDEQVLQEITEVHGDPKKIAADMLKLFEETAAEQGKQRLAAARAAVASDRALPKKLDRLNAAEARRRLQRLVSSDPETARKLTLAARKGERLSDEDVWSMLEDFEELGVISPEDAGPDK